MSRALLALSTDGLQPVASWRGRSVIIVSRALCLFRQFDLSVVPARGRAAALRLAITQWSPYSNWAGAVSWNEDGLASAWIWDADRLQALPVSEGDARSVPVDALPAIPESLLCAPGGRPIELVRVAEGWLARIWSARGSLLADQFFRDLPSAAEWSAALLPFDIESKDAAQALAAANETPAAYARPWPKEWERISPRGTAVGSRLRIVALAATIAFVVGTAWVSVEFLRQQRLMALQAERRAALEATLAPIREARGQAIAAADKLRAWQRLDPFPSALRLLHAFATSVPSTVTVTEFQYESGVVRVALSNPGAQMTGDLVTRLQESGVFSNVRVLPGSDPRSLRFEMDARPLAQSGAAR